MKSFIQTVALSFLTVCSLSFYVSPQSQASATQLNNSAKLTNQTIYNPQVEDKLEVTQVSKGELISYSTYCESRLIDNQVVSCCIDSEGNWACVTM